MSVLSAAQDSASRPAEPPEVVKAQAAAREYSAKLHAFKAPPAVTRATGAEAIAACVQALAEGGSRQTAAYAERLREVLAGHDIQTSRPASGPAAGIGAMTEDELVRVTALSERLTYICWLARTGQASVPAALRQDLWAAIAENCPGNLARMRAAYFLITTAVAAADGKRAFADASSPAVAIKALDSAVKSTLACPSEGAVGADAILAVSAARSLGVFREHLWLWATVTYPAGGVLAAEAPTTQAIQDLIRPAVGQTQSAPADTVKELVIARPLAAERQSLLEDAPAIAEFLSGRRQIEKLMNDFFAAVTKEDKAALARCLADDKTRAQYGQFMSLRKALAPGDEVAELRYEVLKPLGQAAGGAAGPREIRIRAEAYFTWTDLGGRGKPGSINLLLVKTPDGWRVGGR